MAVTLRPRLILGAVALALMLTGCGGGADSSGTVTPSPTVTPTPSPYVFTTPPPISSPALTADGLGPIRLGTPAEEAAAQGWAIRDDRCGWRTAPDLLTDGVELYFTDRTAVWLGSAPTAPRGCSVGMPSQSILVRRDLTMIPHSLGGG